MSNIINGFNGIGAVTGDTRITASQALLRGLDTMLHDESTNVLGEGVSASTFAGILQSVMGTANETDAAAHGNIESMMTGDYDPDLVMLASTKAELALTLMVSVRDRAMEAYNEIMRMQV